MADSNTVFLQTTSSLMNELDVRYAEAPPADQMRLKEELDKAVMTFSEIRCKILENETACTIQDVTQIQALRQEIEQASEVQALLPAIARLTHILAGL